MRQLPDASAHYNPLCISAYYNHYYSPSVLSVNVSDIAIHRRRTESGEPACRVNGRGVRVRQKHARLPRGEPRPAAKIGAYLMEVALVLARDTRAVVVSLAPPIPCEKYFRPMEHRLHYVYVLCKIWRNERDVIFELNEKRNRKVYGIVYV
jgi:hypothetical protein